MNDRVVATIRKRGVHFVEPDLESLVKSVVEVGSLVASNEVVQSEVYLIAVPTPIMENNQPDMRSVEAVTRTLIPHWQEGDLVILESTAQLVRQTICMSRY